MRSAAKQVFRAYVLSIAIWSALSLLTGWQYLIFDKSVNIHSTLLQMLVLAEIRGLAFALLTPPIFAIVQRHGIGVHHRLRYLFLYGVGAIPYMLIYATVRWLMLPPWSPVKQAFISRRGSSPLTIVHEGFADIITIYLATVLAAHAYDYFERVRNQELERSEYRQALIASQLHALKMQLHPHFLFNTLHGISTLIDSDGDSAKAMIVKLSSLLRRVLDQSGSDLVALHEELKLIGAYLDLEKMRFGARLSIDWAIDPATQTLLVPQLILQPLVENAIRHGIASSRDRSWIEIASERRGGIFELRVRNSVGISRPEGTGLGLANTESRLKHLYANEALLEFSISDDRIATASVVLPALDSRTQPDEVLVYPNGRQSERGE